MITVLESLRDIDLSCIFPGPGEQSICGNFPFSRFPFKTGNMQYFQLILRRLKNFHLSYQKFDLNKNIYIVVNCTGLVYRDLMGLNDVLNLSCII